METPLVGGNTSWEIFFNHFPARGWKLQGLEGSFESFLFFFNHFPARGWKRHTRRPGCGASTSLLFQSFPRKGMETKFSARRTCFSASFSIISPQGDGNHNCPPRRMSPSAKTFSIISPQGDGNRKPGFPLLAEGCKLFQSFPRKGMETFLQLGVSLLDSLLFQSFPRKGMETLLCR